MAYTNDTALLQEVRNGIQAIVAGRAQSYSVNMGGGGSRSVTKVSLKELRDLETSLVQRIAAASRGRVSVVRFGNPT